ncbi:MAG: 6-phosphogluconolactonase [Qingshengfaniella sp.]
MKFQDYADQEMMMINLAQRLAGDLNAALMSHDRATFCVPGGSTPGPLFDTLSAIDLDWDRVTVILTDERWVPEESPASNTALVKSRLLTDKAAAAQFFPLYTGDSDPEEALDRLNAGIAPLLPLSVLLLGMGTDLHTASLFPGAVGLKEALGDGASPVAAIRVDENAPARVTLTAPVLKGAMATHVLITGSEKRAALEQAMKVRDAMVAPVTAVLGDATVHWAE